MNSSFPIYDGIQTCLTGNIVFAVCRQPGEAVRLIVQKEAHSANRFILNEVITQKGFLIHPFA
ncbi:MAG: hypothetical protein MI922_18980, partial [Bacteroidales bacterium]|nr:hypothetical protein [Bacteroidales bacterium]